MLPASMSAGVSSVTVRTIPDGLSSLLLKANEYGRIQIVLLLFLAGGRPCVRPSNALFRLGIKDAFARFAIAPV